jgi:hypothetical protein
MKKKIIEIAGYLLLSSPDGDGIYYGTDALHHQREPSSAVGLPP